ncbi:MAG: hypothetical protein KGN01_05495 [Patescibacteria group bacterium]|nr:hypothetical protein [Patescibacteria group bacterium]
MPTGEKTFIACVFTVIGILIGIFGTNICYETSRHQHYRQLEDLRQKLEDAEINAKFYKRLYAQGSKE